jgi:hypothetical protein
MHTAEQWIHTATRASHTCPCCRTKLSPKPDYRVKDAEIRQNCTNIFRELDKQCKEVVKLRVVFRVVC